ncbi:putative DNA-binding transcriptional regulator YafY [Kribbella orskensis]|uniref:DNA-binding transcriptional regulator YafY n=1 Tax=Kribbella orskensis TaxID=2512216 RepID=A0ABY2B8M4_9ACTN|nr:MULTISPECIES: YafY family protein [Kribbella]TCN31541.1 putative DNA-binding transcriptional regulator YafY [Kribbella sp. VKM Ac-2500]TCO11886.1 putative DNA-binding transcriptional regulator YafY [Kribbella orskensis]
MLETSARLLKLLSLLQSPRDWSGTALAEELGVGVRTVRRDVDKLRNLGYPVDAVPGVAGYRLGAGVALPPLLLDDEEAVAVAIGLRAAATGSVSGIEESSVRALTKLEQVLPSRLRHRVRLLQSVAVTPTAGASVAPDVVMAVAAACRDHQRLRFDYRSHDGTSTVRTTEPHRLVHTGRRWYLVAWDLDREDWRTFRLDRLDPRIPTGPRFIPRQAPELDETTRGVASGAYRYQARFLMRAPAEQIADRIANTIGTVEPVDATTCILSTGSNSLDELTLYVGLLGFDFQVESPPELIDHVRTLTTRLGAATPA